MKKSLKQILNETIQLKGFISTYELDYLCKQHHYKLSNAERRLRDSESPDIEKVRKDGVIIGYKVKQKGQLTFQL